MRIRASELNNKVKVRPRIQRAFFSWLIQNRHRLAFDLLIEGRTDHFINFSFIGVNRAISAALTTYEINVSVEWNDECWDLLLSLKSSPRRGAQAISASVVLTTSARPIPARSSPGFFRAAKQYGWTISSSRFSIGSAHMPWQLLPHIQEIEVELTFNDFETAWAAPIRQPPTIRS